MTQDTLSTDFSRRGEAAPGGFLKMLPWIFACLGVLAPLALVAAAAIGSDESAVRAQMIVQGCQMLSVAMMLAGVLGLLYALGLREAALVTGPVRKDLRSELRNLAA